MKTCLAVLLALFLPASPASAQDQLKAQLAQLSRLIGIVAQVDNESVWGNGFIVGAQGCHILTNFHVAFAKGRDEEGEVELIDNPAAGHQVVFYFDLDSTSKSFKRKVRATVVDYGNYEAHSTRGAVGDMALLRIENCQKKEFVGPELSRSPKSLNDADNNLSSIGVLIRTTGDTDLLVEEKCHPYGRSPVTGLIFSLCHSEPGMSGAMLLIEGPDHRLRLAGLHGSGGKLKEGRKVAISVSATYIAKFLDSVQPYDEL